MEGNQYLESIKIMCERCINHEICMGTGCTPKNRLKVLYDHAERLEKALDKACTQIAWLWNDYQCDQGSWDIKEWKEWCMKDANR